MRQGLADFRLTALMHKSQH